jgi:ABC-2 type transport system permease protein
LSIDADQPLFMVGVMIHLFFATPIGIFPGGAVQAATRAALHVGLYSHEHALRQQHSARPHWLATVMQASPSTHFVSFAQSILSRGAGIDVVWPQFLAVAVIGGLFFGLAILHRDMKRKRDPEPRPL